MKLGKLLNNYRQINNITVRELAREIGISIATISRLENNKDIYASTMKKIMVWMFDE